jgi:putative SOS response-associated peptidase YedK
MCFHTSAKKNQQELEKRFNAKVKSGTEIKPHYHINGFNHTPLPVITEKEPNEIQSFYWGLIPVFAKDISDAKTRMNQTLNARCETVFTLPSFRGSIKSKRCLVLVDGFYEWRDLAGKKYPYYIHLKDNDAFAFGGIYNDWVNKETGEIINTVSIITTEANPLMAKIHNSKLRMPLILPKEKERDWINPNLKHEEISDLMKPFDENQMEAYTISKLITSRAENPDIEEVQAPFEYPEMAMFD